MQRASSKTWKCTINMCTNNTFHLYRNIKSKRWRNWRNWHLIQKQGELRILKLSMLIHTKKIWGSKTIISKFLGLLTGAAWTTANMLEKIQSHKNNSSRLITFVSIAKKKQWGWLSRTHMNILQIKNQPSLLWSTQIGTIPIIMMKQFSIYRRQCLQVLNHSHHSGITATEARCNHYKY